MRLTGEPGPSDEGSLKNASPVVGGGGPVPSIDTSEHRHVRRPCHLVRLPSVRGRRDLQIAGTHRGSTMSKPREKRPSSTPASRPDGSGRRPVQDQDPGSAFFRPGAARTEPARAVHVRPGTAAALHRGAHPATAARPIGRPTQSAEGYAATGTPTAPRTLPSPPAARPPRLARRSARLPVEITDFSCGGLDDAPEQSLGVTYWFDAEPAGDPYPMTVHLAGRLRGEARQADGQVSFEVTSTVENVLPGSGRVASPPGSPI